MDRRTPPQPQQERSGNQVDVEQIMREIRGRIAQRQGIDLSNQQIQDLAARRLESILDPRAIKPSMLDALRRSAGAQAQRAAEKIPNEPAFSFEDTTIYDSHRGLMRFMRRLLNPLLKLFFNPNPMIRALHIQARLNVEAAERDAERDRRQTEWNALHYEIIQRLVTEVSRASLELQALSLRVESLDAKVEFNERRVRGLEGSVHRARPQEASRRPADQPAAPQVIDSEGSAPETPGPSAEGTPSSESARRRRRRRRGRRSGMGPAEEGLMNAPRAEALAETSTVAAEEEPPVEQVPDTGIAEAPPVPFERITATVPFEHSVPVPLEQPVVQPIEPPTPTHPEHTTLAPPSRELPPAAMEERQGGQSGEAVPDHLNPPSDTDRHDD